MKQKFEELKNAWLDETKFMSNSDQIVSNSNYLSIINMGKDAIPHIIADWLTSDNHWFVALISITGENPIEPEHRGYIKKMKEDWFGWFWLNDYI